MLPLLLAACTGAPSDSGKDDPRDDTDTAVDTADSGDSDSEDSGDTDTDTDTAPPDPCAEDAVAPEPPTFPDVIGTITATVRTTDGDATYGTDDPTIALCLAAGHCWPLELRDGGEDMLDVGETAVWALEGVDIPRADVDRVTLQVSDGTNRWRPACMDLRFDGEPVYCNDTLDVDIGNGDGETMSWSDPQALHESCTSCAGAMLTHGPWVGVVEPDGARIGLRTDATRATAVRVGTRADMADARIAAWAYPEAGADFTATVAVGCLEPSTRYWFDVQVEGQAEMGEAGSFTTPPELGSPTQATFLMGSCAADEEQPIFAIVEAQAPDALLFLGDNHYANTSWLDDLRWNYRHVLEVPERASAVRNTSTLAVWDDHDYTGNDSDGSAVGKENALRAFVEYTSNPAYGLDGVPGIFSLAHWGDVDLFLLDDRYYRTRGDTILGDAQRAWLFEALAASTATFKLVVDGSQWSYDGGGDSWNDAPEERDALWDLVREAGISGVVLVSGDIHRSEMRRLSNPESYDLPELTSSPFAQSLKTSCGGSDELVVCYDDTDNVMRLDVDTTLADPTLTATILDDHGNNSGRWTIPLSELR